MPTLAILVGPTACGKSALGLKWAQATGGCIINGDSQQLYRGLPLLSAQPDPATQTLVPHYLYGHVDPRQSVSAPDWCQLVLPVLEVCAGADQAPLIVGGTGFYIKALTQGLSPLPQISPEIQQGLEHRAAEEGLALLHEGLASFDPQAHARLKPRDRYRILRAWGVWMTTGTPLSTFQALPKERALGPDWHVKCVFLNPDRAALYERIESRFQAMWRGGALEEVERLMTQEGFADFPAFKALGAFEIYQYLLGKISQEEAITKACQMTRNYAKRQITWFTHQLPEAQVIHRFGEDVDVSDNTVVLNLFQGLVDQ